MKKILLTLGMVIGVATPITAVISCSSKGATPNANSSGVDPNQSSVLDSQKARWMEQVKYSSMTQGEKDRLTKGLTAAKTQTELDAVGTMIAASLGMSWSPSAGLATSTKLKSPISDWNLLKPNADDDFTYDEKRFELKANFAKTDITDPTQWAKLYDAYFYLVSAAKEDIRLTLICKDDRSDKISTTSYLAHANRGLNRMPDGLWEHFMTLIEARGHRGSISDLITGD